jgi:hypothetical protein
MLMIGVLSNLAVDRMENLGMKQLRLPLGVGVDEPYTVILVSADFETNANKLAILVPFDGNPAANLDSICR